MGEVRSAGGLGEVRLEVDCRLTSPVFPQRGYPAKSPGAWCSTAPYQRGHLLFYGATQTSSMFFHVRRHGNGNRATKIPLW